MNEGFTVIEDPRPLKCNLFISVSDHTSTRAPYNHIIMDRKSRSKSYEFDPDAKSDHPKR